MNAAKRGNTGSAEQRWSQICSALNKEAEEIVSARQGLPSPTTRYLNDLATLKIPKACQDFCKRKFGVLDVVISLGSGHKGQEAPCLDDCTRYRDMPTKDELNGHKDQQQKLRAELLSSKKAEDNNHRHESPDSLQDADGETDSETDANRLPSIFPAPHQSDGSSDSQNPESFLRLRLQSSTIESPWHQHEFSMSSITPSVHHHRRSEGLLSAPYYAEQGSFASVPPQGITEASCAPSDSKSLKRNHYLQADYVEALASPSEQKKARLLSDQTQFLQGNCSNTNQALYHDEQYQGKNTVTSSAQRIMSDTSSVEPNLYEMHWQSKAAGDRRDSLMNSGLNRADFRSHIDQTDYNGVHSGRATSSVLSSPPISVSGYESMKAQVKPGRALKPQPKPPARREKPGVVAVFPSFDEWLEDRFEVPELSEGSAVTYAKPGLWMNSNGGVRNGKNRLAGVDGSTCKSVLRQVRTERAGSFKEDSILLGVRFLIA